MFSYTCRSSLVMIVCVESEDSRCAFAQLEILGFEKMNNSKVWQFKSTSLEIFEFVTLKVNTILNPTPISRDLIDFVSVIVNKENEDMNELSQSLKPMAVACIPSRAGELNERLRRKVR